MNTPSLAVKVTPYRGPNEGRAELLAWAELIIADSFVIKDIRVVRVPSKADGKPVTFVSFPSKKGRTDEAWFDIAHPITHDARERAVELILSEYERLSSGKA
jgi:DNA-binding cell septation regulator SpoVG